MSNYLAFEDSEYVINLFYLSYKNWWLMLNEGIYTVKLKEEVLCKIDFTELDDLTIFGKVANERIAGFFNSALEDPNYTIILDTCDNKGKSLQLTYNYDDTFGASIDNMFTMELKPGFYSYGTIYPGAIDAPTYSYVYPYLIVEDGYNGMIPPSFDEEDTEIYSTKYSLIRDTGDIIKHMTMGASIKSTNHNYFNGFRYSKNLKDFIDTEVMPQKGDSPGDYYSDRFEAATLASDLMHEPLGSGNLDNPENRIIVEFNKDFKSIGLYDEYGLDPSLLNKELFKCESCKTSITLVELNSGELKTTEYMKGGITSGVDGIVCDECVVINTCSNCGEFVKPGSGDYLRSDDDGCDYCSDCWETLDKKNKPKPEFIHPSENKLPFADMEVGYV